METLRFNDFVLHVKEHMPVSSMEVGAEGNVIRLANGGAIRPQDYLHRRVRK